jgi:cytochrome b
LHSIWSGIARLTSAPLFRVANIVSDPIIRRVYVWDWPVRLFHWMLLLAVVAAYLTQRAGEMEWHQRIGLGVIGLIVFRLVWGFVGNQHARFAEFLRGPSAIRAYLRGEWKGLGHNPVGGWSVLLLLLIPLGMAATGLFANDDVSFSGLLSAWVDKSVSDRLTNLHYLGFNILLALIGVHLAAIVFYRLKRRVDLVRPMLTGWKDAATSPEEAQDAQKNPLQEPTDRRTRWLALVIALSVSAFAVSGILALEPPPPPASPTVTTPDW